MLKKDAVKMIHKMLQDGLSKSALNNCLKIGEAYINSKPLCFMGWNFLSFTQCYILVTKIFQLL